MKAENGFRYVSVSDSTAIHSIVPRVARLIIAAFIALLALIILQGELSAANRQTQARAGIEANPSWDGALCSIATTTDDNSTRCRQPTLSVTKRIDPTDPDTGGVVTFTFVITDVGLKQLDVVLVHDVSLGMLEDDTPNGQTRLVAAQAAAIALVNELQEADRVAVVAFSDTARLVLPLTANKSAALSAINSLTVHEWTNIGAGIVSGYEELISSTNYNSKTVKSMVLLSDGEANKPSGYSTEPGDYARDMAEAAGDCGILIYTVSFGEVVSATLMQAIADIGGGEYYHSPDRTDLNTIYQEIALELRNLVISDVLPPGVDLDCDSPPDGWSCIKRSGLTTVTHGISNDELLNNPLILSFTATVNLDPGYKGPLNAEGSRACYDRAGGPACQSLNDSEATVGGRRITAVVFEDWDRDGTFDPSEFGIPGVVVTTSNGLKGVTDADGVYTFRTSTKPMLTLAITIPRNYTATTSEITQVPPLMGIYEPNFGLHTPFTGRKNSLDINGSPLFGNDSLAYTITVRNFGADSRLDVTIIDTIPTSTSYLSDSARVIPSGMVTVTDRTVETKITELPSNGSITLTFRVTVDEGAAGREIQNQAYVTSKAQQYPRSLLDQEGPYHVEALPALQLDLAASAQVVRPGTKVVYSYTVSHNSAVATLTGIKVTDSHLGSVSPIGFDLPANMPRKTLTASDTLIGNRTSTAAAVVGGVKGYSGMISGDEATVTVHVIDGILLTRTYITPSHFYHEDSITLDYSVKNIDPDDGVVSGTIFVTDTLDRLLATTPFNALGPRDASPFFSQSFTVPRDISVTVRATALDDVQKTLQVSDRDTLQFCPKDIYERFDDNQPGLQVPTISPGEPPQLHDFWGDEDWVVLQLHRDDESLFTFVASPLDSVQIYLTLFQGAKPLAQADNLRDPRKPVKIDSLLSCPTDVCRYFLRMQSPESGCWTDYQLWAEEVQSNELRHIFLPVTLKDS